MVKEGYGYGLPLLVVAGCLLGFGLYLPGALFLAATLFVCNFFRDPARHIPSDPCAIVSPADGRIVQIVEEEKDGRKMERVSIFMSPLNVHVNRAPVPGVIRDVVYRPGAFRAAFRRDVSVDNEQNVFTIEGSQGTVCVTQIAGVLARRIVFWKHPGDTLARGERVGLIKFGSRVDLLVDQGTEWRAKIGDHVKAGSTILGFTPRRG